MKPHDTFFARLLGRPDNATDALHWALPTALCDRLDWASLTPASTHTRQRSERRGDLAFRIRTRTRDDIGLHILFEHQRNAERRTAFRVAEYTVREWMRQLEAGTPFTRIVPVVLYNGHPAWPYPTTLQAYMPDDGLAELLGDLQLTGGFLLVDLATTPDRDLAAARLGPHTQLGLWLLKYAPRLAGAQFWRHFEEQLGLLVDVHALPDGRARLEAILDYVGAVVGEPTDDNLNALTSALPEPATETVMTWAEALTRRGIEQGIEQGALHMARQTLRRQLTQRFGPLADKHVQAIEGADLDTLNGWLDHVVDAISVDAALS